MSGEGHGHGESKHDVKDRLAPGEPNGTFAARDILMPGIFRVYAAGRLRDVQKFEEMCNNLWLAVSKLPFHPDKDREHARSAFDLAMRAEQWRKQNEIKPDKRAIKITRVVPVPGPASDEATPVAILSGRVPADDGVPKFQSAGGTFREFVESERAEICAELFGDCS